MKLLFKNSVNMFKITFDEQRCYIIATREKNVTKLRNFVTVELRDYGNEWLTLLYRP